MRSFFLFCFVIISNILQAQSFPSDFKGHWEGELHWFQPGKKDPKKVKMQLIIQPADSGYYSWQLIYGEKDEDNRPYLLKPADTTGIHWVIDERNGIVLDQYWIGNRFTGAFTVQATTILNSYWLENGNLFAEFYALSSEPVSKTGGTSKDIPMVLSYASRSYQKAVLKKKNH